MSGICTDCRGSGMAPNGSGDLGRCGHCHGTGSEPMKIQISIAEQEHHSALRHASYLLALARRHIQR